MVLEHIIALLLFSGPLFYLGLWLAIDPEGLATLPHDTLRSACRIGKNLTRRSAERLVEPAHVSGRVRTALRVAGVVLVLLAIAA
jgi:hypothetical protein